MVESSQLSRVAWAAGLPARYHYWTGHSGARYLFTLAEPNSIVDFSEGVAIAVESGRIVWAGPVETLGGGEARAEIFVHLLAGTAEERAAIIADFRPIPAAHLRLAA